MIQIQGQMANVYITYQIVGFGKHELSKSTTIRMRYKRPIEGLSRITSQVIQVYQQWLQESIINWQGGDIIFMDGLCRINKLVQMSEIFQMIQVQLILQAIGGTDYTKQISKRPELFQMIQSNQIGQVYQQSSNDWVVTITAWEQMNQSQYQQVTMQGNTETGSSQSAGIKYFLQSAQTTAFLQMGVSQIYSETGSLNYDIQISQYHMLEYISYKEEMEGILTQNIGQLLITLTLMFKQGAAPFHNWAPDLYDSLPTPITMYVSIIPKIALLLFLYVLSPQIYNFSIFSNVSIGIYIIAIISIIVGSIGLGSQWRIKRFITYSAISHLGFLLIAYVSFTQDSYQYYLFIYGITNILFFYILQTIGNGIKGNNGIDIIYIKEQSGLFKRNPFLTFSQSITFFSLAGIPPQGGFFAKQQVQQGLIQASHESVAIIVIQASVISTTNYLSIIKIINQDHPFYAILPHIKSNRQESLSKSDSKKFSVKPLNSYIISFLTTFLLVFFFKPSILLSLITQNTTILLL